MTKKQRLATILENFEEEERKFLESLGRRALYRALDTQSVDSILIAQLKEILPDIKEKVEKKEEEKKAKIEAKKEEKKAIKERENIETVEDVEFYIPKYGMFTLPKSIFDFFAQTFGFTANKAHRHITNLYIYYPKRCPLIAINIDLDSYMLESLFIDSFEEFLLLDNEEKNYSTFCGLFSKAVFALLNSLGTKAIRKDGKIKHITPTPLSFEELRDKELYTIEEVIEE